VAALAVVAVLATPALEAAAGQDPPAAGTLRITGLFRQRVPQARGLSDRFSIPRPGQSNRLQRYYVVAYHRSQGVTLTNVKVDLLNDVTGAVLQTVTNAAPGDGGVRDETSVSLRVRVTHGNGVTSTINSTPPPTNRIRYRFTLTGLDANNQRLTAVRDSTAAYPLWRMPDGLLRYGTRDAGGDNWASQFTYNWLNNRANRALVTRINDISGEHGRYIGHATHYQGRDIDMFHVYTFPGVRPAVAGAGAANYAALISDTRLAMDGDLDARRRVAAWARQTRARFDQLLANADTRGNLIYALGSYHAGRRDRQGKIITPSLGRGWARRLLESGRYTNPSGQSVDLGIGAWPNAGHARMRYASDHNDHFHLSIRA
jgi:hypothetical protein